MKPLTLILATLALALTACGAPFEAGEFSPSIGQAGSLDAAGGSGSAAGASGAIGLGHAGSSAEAGQGGSEDGAAGAAGEPGMPQAGSAGAPQGGTGSAGAGGSATVPPGHACSPAIDVSGKSMLLLGTGATCLKTTAKFDYFTCSNWDTRIVQVNGAESPCWTMLNYPVPIDGYTYIEISAGTSAQATIAWSDLSTRI